MEGGILWSTVIIWVVFFGIVWLLVKDDKEPKKASQVMTHEVNVNIWVDDGSIDFIRRCFGIKREIEK